MIGLCRIMYSKNMVALGGVLGGLKIRRIDDLHFFVYCSPSRVSPGNEYAS